MIAQGAPRAARRARDRPQHIVGPPRSPSASAPLVGLVVATLISVRLRRIATQAAEIERGNFETELRPRFRDESATSPQRRPDARAAARQSSRASSSSATACAACSSACTRAW